MQLTRQRSDEISKAVKAWVEKNGWGPMCSIGNLWECLEEINEDGTLKPDPDVPERAQEAAARLLTETQIPHAELFAWAIEMDHQDSEAQSFCGPSDRGPSFSLESLDRLTDQMIDKGLL